MTEIDNICIASKGRRRPDGILEQHLEPCPEIGKTNCLTTVAKDNLILQRPRGKNPGGIFTDKAPTLTQTAWEQNNLVVENENLIIQLNPSKESHNTQPYQQNRVYHPDGKTPALMQGTGGRTLKVLTEAGGGHTRIRRLTPTECARLQTVPDWYKWVVSETQQYKMLGNGWTVEVIKHIFSFLPDRFKQ